LYQWYRNKEDVDSCLPELVLGTTGVYDRWNRKPEPNWVTYVPSVAHPDLPSLFSEEFAKRLGLEFRHAIRQNKKRQPWQSRYKKKNDFHWCRNIDGYFTVDEEEVMPGPVILVDYVVGCGCTISTMAALLMQKGSGPVFPFAIAKKDRY
jgi:ATP-dependent DNA helicase RecQ